MSTSNWYEFRVIGREIKRYWVPKGGRECLVVEVELSLKDMDIEVKLTDMLGRPLIIKVELWCREREEPNTTYEVSYENLSTG